MEERTVDPYFVTQSTPFRAWPPPPSGSRRHPRFANGDPPAPRRTVAFLGVVLVVLVVVGQLGGLPLPTAVSTVASWGRDTTTRSADTANGELDLRKVSQPRRLLPLPPTAAGSAYPGSDTPRFDPCQPVRYVVNGAVPFLGAGDLLASAVAEMSRATALQFVAEGASDEAPSTERPSVSVSRYGHRFAPVLIAWTGPETIPALAGSVAGLGGGATGRLLGRQMRVSGLVYVDAPQLRQIAAGPDGLRQARAVLLHELGHVVGLPHTVEAGSLMRPSSQPGGPTGFSPADLARLAHLGAGPCSHLVAGSA